MPTILEERLLPVCGKCEKKALKCEVEPIFSNDGDTIRGRRLRYFCHGTSVVYEIDEIEWKNISDVRPFEPIIFKPPMQKNKPESVADIVRASHNAALRARRDKMWEDVWMSIGGIVATQKTFNGNVEEWCEQHSLRLEQDYHLIQDRSVDVRNLVVNTKTVLGRFELPFYPDEDGWKFVPTAKK